MNFLWVPQSGDRVNLLLNGSIRESEGGLGGDRPSINPDNELLFTYSVEGDTFSQHSRGTTSRANAESGNYYGGMSPWVRQLRATRST